tara:strand:+ start:1062 stop:1187 length:126 start_codon:yes stop_codon:yes gene_type:complete
MEITSESTNQEIAEAVAAMVASPYRINEVAAILDAIAKGMR